MKPFVIECEKYSTTLLYKSIGDKSTRCHFKKKFAAENHEKTLKDYGVKNVSDDWSQFHPLEFLSHSTSSFLFDKEDFFESWWDPNVLFEKPKTSTLEDSWRDPDVFLKKPNTSIVEKSSSSEKKSIHVNLSLDITLMNSKHSNPCPVPFISRFNYDDLYRSISYRPGTGWDDSNYVFQVCGENWIRSHLVKKKDNNKSSISRKRSPRAAGVKSLDHDQASDPIIFDLILRNFKQVCIFRPNKRTTGECRLYTDQYVDDLWLSSLRMYGRTTFTPKILKEYPHAAKTLEAYSEGFEVADYLVKLFPISVLENLGNGKWQNIPQEVLLSINSMRQTAYKGIFKSIIPCIPTTNQHLIRLHGTKQFHLVDYIPLLALFEGDKRTLDKTSYVLYACNAQIYFGIGKKLSSEKNLLKSEKEVLSASVFRNDDQQCIIGSFVKMCSSILLPDLQVKMDDWLVQNKYRKEEKAINILLKELNIGHLVKSKDLESSVGNPVSWVLSHSETKQPFLVAIRGIQGKCGHCIGVCDGKIFNATGDSSLNLSAKILEEALGEKVNSIVWCKNFYPYSWCCP